LRLSPPETHTANGLPEEPVIAVIEFPVPTHSIMHDMRCQIGRFRRGRPRVMREPAPRDWPSLRSPFLFGSCSRPSDSESLSYRARMAVSTNPIPLSDFDAAGQETSRKSRRGPGYSETYTQFFSSELAGTACSV
jgi:hypothetical protein